MGKKRGVGLRVSEVIGVTMQHVLVLLFAAMMAVVLSVGLTATPAEAHTVPACYKSEGAAKYKNPHCKKDHNKKDHEKKDKKNKKGKKYYYSY